MNTTEDKWVTPISNEPVENGEVPSPGYDEAALEAEMVQNKSKSSKGAWGAAGIAGLLGLKFLAKLKILFVFLKASKFLSTLISMGVTIWAYALIYGFWFALGFVLLIFCHEMGHYLVARWIGIEVSSPFFIPFLGAMISLKENPKTAEEEALMAAGGPAAGIVASLFCFLVYGLTGVPLFSALAYVGLFLNLFNLIPIHPLDGGRISVAVTPWLWAVGIPIGLFLAFKTHSIILGLILLLGIHSAWQSFKGDRGTYFADVPKAARIAFGIGYLAMIFICGAGMMYIFMNHLPTKY